VVDLIFKIEGDLIKLDGANQEGAKWHWIITKKTP